MTETNRIEFKQELTEHFLRMTFPIDREGTAISGGQIGGAIESGGQILELTHRQKGVLGILVKDEKTSRVSLAKLMNIRESAVFKHLEILKEKGYIERIGGTRGFWKIKRNSHND